MALTEMNENWEKDAPTLASIQKGNPFSVPEGYFTEMQQQLHATINIARLDQGQTRFNTPEKYFETLSEQIISRIKLEQLKEEANSALVVPDNYFESLENKVRARLALPEGANQEVKVRKLGTSWFRYAAAACVTAIVGLGIYFYQDTAKGDTIEAKIASVPADEIINYLQLYSDAGDAPVILENLEGKPQLSDLDTQLSDEAIEEYLETNL